MGGRDSGGKFRPAIFSRNLATGGSKSTAINANQTTGSARDIGAKKCRQLALSWHMQSSASAKQGAVKDSFPRTPTTPCFCPAVWNVSLPVLLAGSPPIEPPAASAAITGVADKLTTNSKLSNVRKTDFISVLNCLARSQGTEPKGRAQPKLFPAARY